MKISVIIPTLNEEQNIARLIAQLLAMPEQPEIIVADGGSADGTLTAARNHALCISCPPGRARQMNAGAQAASGDVLLFLHADSRLAPDALQQVNKALTNQTIVGGCFRLVIDSASFILKLVALGSNLRARFGGLIFGDQGIFVRRQVFEELGGFPEIELMEDWEFSKALHKKGQVTILDTPVYTSPRRWEKHGTWRTLWLMHKIKLLYHLGRTPVQLKKLYRDHR